MILPSVDPALHNKNVNVVGHDAKSNNRISLVKDQNLFTNHDSKGWISRPLAPVGSGHSDRHDMVLSFEDLGWQMVFSSVPHLRIVHRKCQRTGPKGPDYRRHTFCRKVLQGLQPQAPHPFRRLVLQGLQPARQQKMGRQCLPIFKLCRIPTR